MSILTVVLVVLSSLISLSVGTLNDVMFNGDYEFIDLTHPFDNRTIYWPDSQKFEFTKKIEENHSEDNSWYAANDFAAGEHGGTHIDAPYHFSFTGQRVGELPLEKLLVPLVIVDISSVVNDDPNFLLYKHHLDYLLNDNMGKPCLVIFKFGWSKYFYNPDKYMGLNKETNALNFPGISEEVAEWITTSFKNVVGIGVDVASIDSGSSNTYPVHKIITSAGLYGIENVNLNVTLPNFGCTALALPMKIAMGTGAPLRLVAVCPRQKPCVF